MVLFAAWLVILWWGIHWAAKTVRGEWAARQPAPPALFSLAELRSPKSGCFLGVFLPGAPEDDDLILLKALEDRVRFRFPLISLYQAWGGRVEHRFDPRPLNRILDRGGIPVLTWEPWVTEFNRPGLAPMPDRQFRSLDSIARGDYDFFIEEWAQAAKRWDRPLMVRLGHEMNATWYPWGERAYGNTANDYIRMWRHVVNVFRRVGADNVIWVWSVAQRPMQGLYPGNEWVDWVGITILNFGTVPPGWKWRSFGDLFQPHYSELAATGKPIMIAEVASAEEGGDKARWTWEALGSLPSKFPAVRAFMWFDVAQDKYWTINWSLTSSVGVTQAFRRATADPYFIAVRR